MIKPGNWIGLADSGNVLACLSWPDCDTYVGVHRLTMRPMGRMAGRETRSLRMKAHRELDPLWREHGYDRNYVYRCLSEDIGYAGTAMHISDLSDDELRSLVEAARMWRFREHAKRNNS